MHTLVSPVGQHMLGSNPFSPRLSSCTCVLSPRPGPFLSRHVPVQQQHDFLGSHHLTHCCKPDLRGERGSVGSRCMSYGLGPRPVAFSDQQQTQRPDTTQGRLDASEEICTRAYDVQQPQDRDLDHRVSLTSGSNVLFGNPVHCVGLSASPLSTNSVSGPLLSIFDMVKLLHHPIRCTLQFLIRCVR